jgi:hypothetical protein
MPALKLIPWALFIAACATGIDEAILTLPVTAPEQPQTQEDTLKSLALRRAIEGQRTLIDVATLPSTHRIIIAELDGQVTARSLPASDSVSFVLLSDAEIRELADRHGHFVFVVVGAVRFAGDSAIVGIGTRWAPSRRNPGVVYLGGGVCPMQFRRLLGAWAIDTAYRGICVAS